jgi:Zn ribbon nucleic-acid-binding protein
MDWVGGGECVHCGHQWNEGERKAAARQRREQDWIANGRKRVDGKPAHPA